MPGGVAPPYFWDLLSRFATPSSPSFFATSSPAVEAFTFRSTNRIRPSFPM
jgi:hypothetical protein